MKRQVFNIDHSQMKTLYQINVFLTCFWLPTFSQTFNSLFCYLKFQTLLSIIHYLVLQPIISSWYSQSIKGLHSGLPLICLKVLKDTSHWPLLSFFLQFSSSQLHYQVC